MSHRERADQIQNSALAWTDHAEGFKRYAGEILTENPAPWMRHLERKSRENRTFVSWRVSRPAYIEFTREPPGSAGAAPARGIARK